MKYLIYNSCHIGKKYLFMENLYYTEHTGTWFTSKNNVKELLINRAPEACQTFEAESNEEAVAIFKLLGN